MQSRGQPFWQSVRYGALAGAVAVAVNLALLQWSSAFGLPPGDDSLLELLLRILHPAPVAWDQPPLARFSPSVWAGLFHVAIGLGMAVFYAVFLEPRLRRAFTPLTSGLFYALGVWLVNTWVILPALGLGIAGENAIPVAGMVYFALAHTAFFVVLALLYAKLAEWSAD